MLLIRFFIYLVAQSYPELKSLIIKSNKPAVEVIYFSRALENYRGKGVSVYGLLIAV